MNQIPSTGESVWRIVGKITCYQRVGGKVIVNSQLWPTHFLTFLPSFRFYLCQPPHVTSVSQRQPFSSLAPHLIIFHFRSMNVEHLSRNWEMQGLSWQCLLPLTHAMPFAIISTDCGGTCSGIVSSCLSLGCREYAVWSRVITAPGMTYFFSYSRKWGKKAEWFARSGCGWRWCGSGCVKRGAWHNQGRAKWKRSPFCCSQPA